MKRRKDGRYCLKWTGKDGSRHYAYGKTVAEAREKQKAQEELIRQGITQRRDISLAAYADSWMKARHGTVSEATEHVTGRTLKAIIDRLGARRLRDIQQRDVIEMRADMLAEGRSPYYINARIARLKSVLNAAVIARYIAYNPAKGIQPLKDSEAVQARDTIHRALTTEELEAVLSYTDSTIYGPVFRLLLYTGMRAGEALALTDADIDTEAGVIHITKTVSTDSTGIRLISPTPKTQASRRDIPLTDQVKDILPKDITGRLFSTPEGGLVIAANLDRVLYRFFTRHRPDIEPFSCHALRDTFATIMVDQGCPPHVLRDILGHKTLTMTMDLYYHNSSSNSKRAMEAVKFPT